MTGQATTDRGWILEVCQLGFAYDQHPVFENWSAVVPSGLSFACGEEGCGKSTLLRLLAGVLPVQAGRLRLRGGLEDPSASAWQSAVFWADPRDERQDRLNVLACLLGHGQRHPGFDEALARDIARALGLAEHLDKSMFMLSTGSRRKLLLSAAFASGAALTLIDEPFAGLDRASTGVLLELLQDAAEHPSRAWLVADHVVPEEIVGINRLELPPTR